MQFNRKKELINLLSSNQVHPLFLEELSDISPNQPTAAIVTTAIKSFGGVGGSYLVKGKEVLKIVFKKANYFFFFCF